MLGVQLFSYVIRGEMLTEDRNFESFGNALLLLFQALTGDDPGRDDARAAALCERGCNYVCQGLRLHVPEAATLRVRSCKPQCPRLQPHVGRRRLVRDDERVRRVAT